MRRWLRRARGAIGIGLTWAATWFGAGIVFMVAAAPHPENPFFVAWGVFGFIAGVAFASLLGIIERRRGVDQLSLRRVTAWGAIGGLSLAVAVRLAGLAGPFLLVGPLFALAGAGCAAATLALARKGGDRPSIRSRADPLVRATAVDERRTLPQGDADRRGRP
jgi:hypothetical protein